MALALRVPFRSALPYHWDGAEFALARGFRRVPDRDDAIARDGDEFDPAAVIAFLKFESGGEFRDVRARGSHPYTAVHHAVYGCPVRRRIRRVI